MTDTSQNIVLFDDTATSPTAPFVALNITLWQRNLWTEEMRSKFARTGKRPSQGFVV